MKWVLVNKTIVRGTVVMPGEVVDDASLSTRLYQELVASGAELWSIDNAIMAAAQLVVAAKRVAKGANEIDAESYLRAAASRARMPAISRLSFQSGVASYAIGQALKNVVLADTSGGPFAFVFPTSPVDGDEFTLVDSALAGSWGTNALTATAPGGQSAKSPAADGSTFTSMALNQTGRVINWFYGKKENAWLLAA